MQISRAAERQMLAANGDSARTAAVAAAAISPLPRPGLSLES
jgi:hypothetical protein